MDVPDRALERCLLRPGVRRAVRPDQHALGQVPSVGPLGGDSLRPALLAGLCDAQCWAAMEADLCLGDLHSRHDCLLGEQHALFGLDGGHDSRRGRALQYCAFPICVGLDRTIPYSGAGVAAGGQIQAGNSAKGWACTMAIFGAIIIVCNVIVFFSTKERVAPPPEQESSLKSLAEDIRNVFTCRPWLVMFVVTLLIFTTLALRGSSLNYMIKYYVEPAAMTGLLNKIGLGAGAAGEVTGWRSVLDALGLLVKPDYSNASSVGFSFFFTLGSIIQILGILISKPLSDLFGKKIVFITGLTVTTFATAAIFYVQPTDVNQMLFWSVVWPLGWGPRSRCSGS